MDKHLHTIIHIYMNIQAEFNKKIGNVGREAWTTLGWFDYCMQLTLCDFKYC